LTLHKKETKKASPLYIGYRIKNIKNLKFQYNIK
jgi:hypothetical protein